MDRNDELSGTQRLSACIGLRHEQRKAAFKTRDFGNANPAWLAAPRLARLDDA